MTKQVEGSLDLHVRWFEEDRAYKIKNILNELGIKIENTSAFRMKLQPIIYLIEAFGIDLGFRFNWFLHGPYDIHLTRRLYDIE